jgi:hypothetical protein
MSERYPGGIISQTAPVPTGPFATGTAPGVWTLEQQAYWARQGLWPIAGNFPNYIEDVFNTWVYTLDYANTSYTIQNNIDLSTKGGLVWFKPRSQPSSGNGQNCLFDTARGSSSANQRMLISNSTAAQTSGAGDSVQFNADGFTAVYEDGGTNLFRTTNNFGAPYNQCAWTFREQPKFFDVVTYTGNDTAGRTVSHNLGSVPGMIIVKATSTSGYNWVVHHRSIPSTQVLLLNTTDDAQTTAAFNNTAPTSTVFTLGSSGAVNGSGITYVAYLFAHNAGGFGTTGTDNVISCGSFVQAAGTSTINLGFEPQYVLLKSATGAGDWWIVDNMRNFSVTGFNALLANTSAAEIGPYAGWSPTATGFTTSTATFFSNGTTYIYMAIRRPMKVPTTGTSVFSPSAVNVSAGTAVTTGFPIDWQINYYRSFAANYNSINATRLLGTSSTSTESGQVLWTAKTDAQTSFGMTRYWDNTGFQQTSQLWPNINNIYWNFRRAPGFFDVVCYTATGSGGLALTHNLGVVPEMMIVKGRSGASDWPVYHVGMDASPQNFYQTLNSGGTKTNAVANWNNTMPTSTQFTVGGNNNASGYTYIAYLFATCAGVSKVGSYTGNGAARTIDCGFTTGARFVLIKSVDQASNWWVWDTARGMVAGTDPSLNLNDTSAELNFNSIYTAATGFQLLASPAQGINNNGEKYIFLAIA